MPSEFPSSADLVARVRSGSADALAELYARYAGGMMALAFRLTGTASDAEDVLHDVFLGIPDTLRRYDEQGTLEAWLKRVTARVALTLMRARSRAREVAFDVGPEPADNRSADTLNDLVAVRTAIDALPDTLRAVFVLHEVEGYPHAEVAALLGITTGASEVRLHRALKALRRALIQPE